MPTTITTGTTAATTVLIAGNETGANDAEVVVWEQIVSGTPTGGNSILLGSTTSTGNSGSFSSGALGDNFAVVVAPSGFTSYIVGATGAAGDIFFRFGQRYYFPIRYW
jgi:hypothetical protein